MVRHKIAAIAVVGNDACWTQIVRDQVRFLGRATAGMLTYQDYHLVAKVGKKSKKAFLCV